MPKENSKKIIKAWAVIWAFDYDAPYAGQFITLTPEEDLDRGRLKVKCHCKLHKGWHYLDGLAVFEKKTEAKVYQNGVKDFKVVPLEIRIVKTPNPHA